MTPDEYIEEINKLKNQTQNSILTKIPTIERQSYDLLLDWIDASLDTQAGKFVATPQTTDILNDFTASYLKVMQDLSDYKGSVSRYIKNLKDFDTLVKDFQKTFNHIDLRRANITADTELVVNEIVNMYLDNGLNVNFVQPLRDILFQNISAGNGVRQSKAQLKEFIRGGRDTSGKLDKYLTQTAQQGVDSYTGAINKKLMDKFEFTHLIMSGSLIKTSSPQCRHVVNDLGGIISRKDWPKVRKIALNNGLIEGTTFDNLPFNKLHWGCRHEFTPVILTEEQIKNIIL